MVEESDESEVEYVCNLIHRNNNSPQDEVANISPMSRTNSTASSTRAPVSAVASDLSLSAIRRRSRQSESRTLSPVALSFDQQLRKKRERLQE